MNYQTLKEYIKYCFNKLIDTIFPKKCIYCNRLGKIICNSCLTKIQNQYLFQKVNNDWFDYVFCGSFYRNVIRTQIHSFKFHEKSYLYQYFIEMSTNKNILAFLENFDFVTYVPMYYQKEQKRGYNQSKLLAEELGKKLNKTVINVLDKKIDNKVQSSLSERDRIKNVENVFCFQENITINNKNIILVDDILTTGATARSCSKILKDNGANKICIFTISKA